MVVVQRWSLTQVWLCLQFLNIWVEFSQKESKIKENVKIKYNFFQERSASSHFKAPTSLSPSSTSVVRCSSYSKIIQISRQKRDQDYPDQTGSDRINSFGTDSDDGEEHRRRRLQMNSSMKIRGHISKNNSLEVPGSPGNCLLLLLDFQIRKTNSLMY